MDEEWRAITAYSGVYEVSNLGRVRRIAPGRRTRPGFVLKPRDHRRRGAPGYLSVKLSYNGRVEQPLVHKLVADAFIGLRPTGHEINHKDCDRHNNRADNLEYVTHLENQRHAAAHGRFPQGEQIRVSKLTREQVRELRAAPSTTSISELSRRFGIARSTARSIIARETWRWV